MKNGWQNFFSAEGGSPPGGGRGASGGKDKRITLMGLGLLGRGVGDAAFLAQCGAKVLVTDKKSAKELASSVAKLKRFRNIRFRLGGHDLRDFSARGGHGADMILKAAGVPLDSPYIAEARKNKVPVYMSTALFVKLLPEGTTVIGVTGTRGKTTTAFLLFEILKKQFQISNFKFQNEKEKRTPKVFLGGNVQGISTLALLPKIKSGDFVVLELDSWQLQGFGDLRISPQVAVFTTFLPDHMNYYNGSMRRYFEDKARIFKYQRSNEATKQESTRVLWKTQARFCLEEELRDGKRRNLAQSFPQRESSHVFIAGEQAMPFVKKWEPKHARRAVVARASDVPKNWKLKILGEHNRYNAACALRAADTLGIPRAVTKKAVESFRGVPGRLEFVRDVRGVKIYNDTTATTPEATIAALRALGGSNQSNVSKSRTRHSNILKNVRMSCEVDERKIILIMGGADKGLDMSGLVKEIPKWCKAVVLLTGSGTEKFQISNFKFLNKFQIPNSKFQILEAKTLKESVVRALEMAKSGDIILFSPAFASFGMFKNEYDRGEQFNKLVCRK